MCFLNLTLPLQAHIRGGGEMGRVWYEDGKYLKKENTFLDFIACAEHLVKGGYTSPQHLAIEGRSAGGLLIGAVCNMRPELFHSAILGVRAALPQPVVLHLMVL